VHRYEQLRERALAGEAGGWRCGLALLQHRGVVAWLHASRSLAPTPANPPAGAPVASPAPGVADRLIEALAAMALAVVAGR
jgi:hypothetical protein